MPSILSFHLSVTFFLLGWLLLAREHNFSGSKSKLLKFFALVLIGISIGTTSSLGTFFMLPFLHLVFLGNSTVNRVSFKFLASRVVRLSPLWLVPIGSFLGSRFFFEPFGIYQNYNSFRFPELDSPDARFLAAFLVASLVSLAVLMLVEGKSRLTFLIATLNIASLLVVSAVFFEIADRRDRRHNVWQKIGLEELLDLDLALLLAMVVTVFVGASAQRFAFPRRDQSHGDAQSRLAHKSLAFGLLGLSLGMIPYLLVGKTPSPTATDDRLELLLAVALPWVILGSIQIIGGQAVGRPNRCASLSVFLLAGLVGTLYFMIEAQPTLEGVSTRFVPLASLWVVLCLGAAAFRRKRISAVPESARALLAPLLVSVLLFGSLATSVAIAIDWKKQALIIEAIKGQPKLVESSTIIFTDELGDKNWDGRLNAIYEVTGWVRGAFGHAGILGVSSEHTSFDEALDGGSLESPELQAYYGFMGWNRDGRVSQVVLQSDSSALEFFFGEGKISLDVIDDAGSDIRVQSQRGVDQ
jgi:hypothetical protein